MAGGTNDAWTAQSQRRVPARRLEKQIALAKAACPVFGRDGYTRASVGALAAAAGVSTRTLYNHFPDGKAELFRTVVTWTSHDVRDAQLAALHAVLDPARPPHADDLERDLTVLARAFVGLMADYPDHFALVRHIHAEAGHVPQDVLDAWHDAGPGPVARALGDAMAQLAADGLLDAHGDPAMAGAHFTALTAHQITLRSHYGVLPLPEAESERLITGGVAAFLRAYRA